MVYQEGVLGVIGGMGVGVGLRNLARGVEVVLGVGGGYCGTWLKMVRGSKRGNGKGLWYQARGS